MSGRESPEREMRLDGVDHGTHPGRPTGHERQTSGGRIRSIDGIVFNAILLAFTIVLLFATIGLHASSRTVPLAVGLPLAALLAYRLFRESIGTRSTAGLARARSDAAGARGEMRAILWIAGLPLASTLLGFVAGPAIWVSAWAKVRGRERMAIAIAAGIVVAVFIQLFFGTVLGVSLPIGLFGAIRQP